MRRLLVLLVALVAASAVAPAHAASSDKVPMEVSKGDTLSAEEEAAVRSVLFDYLNSLKARDFRRAGGHIDEGSFRALADTIVFVTAVEDSLPPDQVRLMIFGVASPDSMLARPVPVLFEAFVASITAGNPGAFGAVTDAQIDVLAIRRVDHRVVIAYQLTIPGAGPEGQPVTTVSAETMRPTPKGWKIVFQR